MKSSIPLLATFQPQSNYVTEKKTRTCPAPSCLTSAQAQSHSPKVEGSEQLYPLSTQCQEYPLIEAPTENQNTKLYDNKSTTNNA